MGPSFIINSVENQELKLRDSGPVNGIGILSLILGRDRTF